MLEPAHAAARWPVWLGTALTAAMVAGLGYALLDDGLAGLERAAPDAPGFYAVFLAMYLAVPVADWIIFRRLWRVPPAAFAALLRKRVANDVLLGYSGDAWFYAWARAHLAMVAAPFGAVKDTTLLSGAVNNLANIALGIAALGLGRELIAPDVWRALAVSLAVPVILSAAVLVFRRRVFSLPPHALRFVFAVEVARTALTTILLALAWSLALPQVDPALWLFLVAGRQLVLQLPFLPNKELLFANFAILLIGEDRALTGLIAFTAGSTLLLHLAVTATLGAAFVLRRVTPWPTIVPPNSKANTYL